MTDTFFRSQQHWGAPIAAYEINVCKKSTVEIADKYNFVDLNGLFLI